MPNIYEDNNGVFYVPLPLRKCTALDHAIFAPMWLAVAEVEGEPFYAYLCEICDCVNFTGGIQ